MTLTHIYVGTYSYDYASYDAFVQSKIAFFKFTGSKAESFSKESHAEKVAEGKYYAALVEVARKLSHFPLGAQTVGDAFGCTYFLVPTATPGVAALSWRYGSGVDECCEFDWVEGQSASDFEEATAAMVEAVTAPTQDALVPAHLMGYRSAETPDLAWAVKIA